MKYLDYNRVFENVDIPLRTLLLTVYNEDTLRRLRVAFPEYFSDEPPVINKVLLSDITLRYKALEVEDTEILATTLDWFGLTLYEHEYRDDGKKHPDSELLPQDFKLMRDDDYDGLSGDDFWVTTLFTEDCPEGQEHLVLKVLTTGDTCPEYFIWTTPIKNIDF